MCEKQVFVSIFLKHFSSINVMYMIEIPDIMPMKRNLFYIVQILTNLADFWNRINIISGFREDRTHYSGFDISIVYIKLRIPQEEYRPYPRIKKTI